MTHIDISVLQEAGKAHWLALTEKHPSPTFDVYKDTLIKAFGLSDFIATVAVRYPLAFENILTELCATIQENSPSYGYEQYRTELAKQLNHVELEPKLHACIRQFRHLTMLKIAWLDMLTNADFKASLAALSELADTCINLSLDWLYEKACIKYGAPREDQILLVLGMGKLGGRELNFSSDIDLIFVYPSNLETQHARKPIEHQSFFTKLAQKLIASLHQTTLDGQAYRVDMRLRPLGESGPLVLSMPAFETYYQEQGRDWERFAMQKARVLNSTSSNNQHFIEALENIINPYVYRKYLDFTTLDSLRKMKQLIAAEVKRRKLTNNIKLGQGGIREVEFYVQCHQLIHAGRISECQTQSLYLAIQALVEHKFIQSKASQELVRAYTCLRQVEHYLQAFNDQQTQTLPEFELAHEPAHQLNPKLDQTRLTVLLDAADYQSAVYVIESHMSTINKHFKQLIEPDEPVSNEQELDSIYADLWKITLSQDESVDILAEHFDVPDAQRIEQILAEAKLLFNKSSLGDKSRQALDKLVPTLMSEVLDDAESVQEKNVNKQITLMQQLLTLLSTIAGRATYLDLLNENQSVRTRLIFLFSKSEWIAQQINRFPLLLDELLHPAYLNDDKGNLEQWRAEFDDTLKLSLLRIEPDDIEAQMDALRAFKITQQLRIAAADITGHLPVNRVSDKLTILAEVILAQAIELAWAQMTQKFGIPSDTVSSNTPLPNQHFAILAFGKMGGWEMGYGSDIDMVCIHDADSHGRTSGEKSLSNSEFYIKLVQRLSHIFTSKTYLGMLYEIDLRLRPSGNSGLLISHIETFNDYQKQQAWTWEHQALTRSRCIYGSDSIKQRFLEIRTEVLSLSRDAEKLRKDVCDMRVKMRAHLDKSHDQWLDLKQTRGGITDIEFLVQYLVLQHAHQYPELTRWSDNLRVLDSLAAQDILPVSQVDSLQQAYLHIRHRMHKLSLHNKTLCHNSDSVTQFFACIEEVFKVHLEQ